MMYQWLNINSQFIRTVSVADFLFLDKDVKLLLMTFNLINN